MKIDPELVPIITAVIGAASGIIAAAIPAVPLYIAEIILAIIALAAVLAVSAIVVTAFPSVALYVIALILGAITVAAIIYALKIYRRSVERRVMVKVFIIFLVLTLACLIWILFFELKIKVTYPDNGAQVDLKETIRGQARNVPDKDSVWIVVYSHPDMVYYPNRSKAWISNCDFTSPDTDIGASEDKGKQFDIIALLVDEKGLKEIQEYLGKTDRSGLPQLPSGKVYGSITVTRKSQAH